MLFLLQMIWNGNSYAELSVPGSYKRKMCGLCGNFNGFPQDDLKTRSGHVTNSPAVFGNTWKVGFRFIGDNYSKRLVAVKCYLHLNSPYKVFAVSS